MKAKSFRKRAFEGDGEESLLNLTPLIDVVFVVLIIFILIAPMLEVDKIELASGKAQEHSEPPKANSLALYVREDNSIWMETKKIAPEELVAFLIEQKKNHPSHALQLFHDKKAYFGTYQQIKNAAESAGFEELDVIVKPGN